MNMAGGFSGEFGSTRSTKTFGDGRERNTKGQYGADVKTGSSVKSFFRNYEFNLAVGEYQFGKVKLNINPSSFAFSADIAGTHPAPLVINQKLSAYAKAEGVSPEFVDSLTTTLANIGCDLNSVTIKEMAIEGPSISVGANLGQSSIGAKAGAQFGAMRLTLITPMGELDFKLKRGLGIGGKLSAIKSQKGDKPGVGKEQSLSFANWEVSLRPNEPHSITPGETPTPEKKRVINAQTRATTFVKERTGSTSQISQVKSSEADLLDGTIEEMSAHFPDDPTVIALYQTYQKSDNRPKAFLTFQKELSKHLQSEAQFKSLVQAGTAASIFLSQVAQLSKSKELAQTAMGISALTQAFSGIKELDKSIALINAPSALGGGLSLGTLTGCLNGAGLVLGAISMVSSLFGGSNDGIGEALAEIHSAIMGMWSEMRESFQVTWQMLEAIDSKLNAMEAQNQERFKLTMQAMKYSYDELHAQIETSTAGITQQLQTLQTDIVSYLDHIAGQDAKVVMSEIQTTSLMAVPDKLSHWSAVLNAWLTDTATLDNGGIKRIQGKLDTDTAGLIRSLDLALSPEYKAAANIPLGLFLNLAQELDPASFTQHSSTKMINPKGWLAVFDVYARLLRLSANSILNSDANTIEGYRKQIDAVNLMATNVLDLLSTIADSSTLWDQLINNYQDPFDQLKKRLKDEQPKSAEGLTFPYRWDLSKDATTNIKAFEISADAASEAKKITQSLSWVGLRGTRQADMIQDVQHMGRPGSAIPDGDLGLSLTQSQYDALVGRPEVAAEFSKLQSNTALATAVAYGIAKPSLFYNLYNVGGANHYWDFALYVAASVDIKGQSYPFVQGSLFQQISRYHGWGGNINDYTATDAPRYWSFRFKAREDFAKNFDKIFSQEIDSTVLVPSRKAVVTEITRTETDLKTYLAKIQSAYLQMIAFIQLLDPTFSPTMNPRALQKLGLSIQSLAASGDAQAFSELDSVISGMKRIKSAGVLQSKVWQEELWPYLGDNLVDFTTKNLRAKVKAAVTQHPLRTAMLSVQERIQSLKDHLDPNQNHIAATKKLQSFAQSLQEELALFDQSIIALDTALTITRRLGTENITMLDRLSQDLTTIIALRNTLAETQINLDNAEPDPQTTAAPPVSLNLSIDPSAIQRLCADPDTEIEAIKAELARLEHESALDSTLNTGNIAQRPLSLAIHTRRVDVITLLLEHDAKIVPTHILPDTEMDEVSNKIRALLHFYSFMQGLDLGELAVGKTLALLRESIESLRLYTELEDAIIFLGKTGAGKSTLINALLGIKYVLQENEAGDSYLVAEDATVEKTATSRSSKSETTYPTILTSPPTTLSIWQDFMIPEV
jgi:ABC-type multidrug transport system fused ATPase/permease subunit